jgi:hypothetical protein
MMASLEIIRQNLLELPATERSGPLALQELGMIDWEEPSGNGPTFARKTGRTLRLIGTIWKFDSV